MPTRLNIKNINAKEIVKGFAWLVAFVLVLIGINVYIEGIVEKKISDPDMIEKVKAQIRPMVVFNQNESILVDTGGMQYIESIRVILDPKQASSLRLSRSGADDFTGT